MATEAELLSSLGITDSTVQNDIISGAARLLVLDCSAHLDWDWLLPFPVLAAGGSQQRASWYFPPGSSTKGPANEIFTQAAGQIASSAYHFSICEMAFLRAFANSDATDFATLSANAGTNSNLRIAGGGITSPDNLLTHGEAFIRCYLLGHQWLAQTFPGPPAPVSAWLPDDFGHDVNLPIVIQAMGLSATGFQRIPGNASARLATPINGGDSLAATLTSTAIDFTWQAPDGSSILAHWLIGKYSQGGSLSSVSDITTYLNLNANPSPTPYIYVPVLDDFMLPNTAITGIIADNSPVTWTNPNGGAETVYLAAGAFEDYAQLVQFHTLTAMSFNPIPYWTGYFATRPALKILHQQATRTLLAAEVLSLIANIGAPAGWTSDLGTGDSQTQLFNDAWQLLVPSASRLHHRHCDSGRLSPRTTAVAPAGGLARAVAVQRRHGGDRCDDLAVADGNGRRGLQSARLLAHRAR